MNTPGVAKYQTDDWLYRAIQAKYGWVNTHVLTDINDPDFDLGALQPANTDPAKSQLRCDAINGGDDNRPAGAISFDDTIAHVHNHMCGTGSVLLKKSPDGWCSAVSPEEAQNMVSCGYEELKYVEATPISLLWDPALTLENFGLEVRLVSFALDLRDPNASQYEWKASGQAPLLVYDPEHKGVVTSATQLFGSWSFGGKGGSKLDSAREHWDHGYEALATQDRDGDGKISGAELDALALWFDHNRDAISQPGEVVSAKKAGLVELFYREASEAQSDGSRHLNLGFRRLEGSGLLYSGASIDWTARAAEVGHTLYEADLTRPTTKGGGLSVIQSASNAGNSTQAKESRAVPSSVGGYWRWVNGKSLTPSTGILFLRALEDGTVDGSTVSESVFMHRESGEKLHEIRFVTVRGALDSKDRSKVAFSMLLPNNGQSARSSASVVEEGGKIYLKGSTEALLEQSDGSKRMVSYDWTAERITSENIDEWMTSSK